MVVPPQVLYQRALYKENNGLFMSNLPSDIPYLWDIHKKNTGKAVDLDQWKSSRDKRENLLRQSTSLAMRLESAGYPAITSKNISFVGAITGHIEMSPAFRNICFLPSVARQKRSSMLRDLIYWQSHTKGGKFLRYLVITNGQLVRLDELGNNIQKFNRKISKWASESKARYGIDVVFRGLEFPIKENIKAHLHANILYMPTTRLAPEKFSEFMSWTHEYFGTVLHDAGRLKEPREAIKYPFKPNDLQHAKGANLKVLAEQVFGQRIIEALGSFRKWRQEIKDNRVKTMFDGGLVILAKQYKREKRERDEDDKPISKSNRLVGIMPPMAHGIGYQEPVLIIEGDIRTVFETDESLRVTCFEFRKWWDESGAPQVSFNLDNRTVSVQKNEILIRPPPDPQLLIAV